MPKIPPLATQPAAPVPAPKDTSSNATAPASPALPSAPTPPANQ